MLVAVLCGILCCVFLAVVVLILRVLLVLRRGTECKPGEKGSVCVLVVAGSGGHTTEIIRLMGSLSQSYTPRHYVMADTDKMSEDKIRAFEASKQKGNIPQEFTIHRIPRSREVRQSWSSSVHSTLYALVYSVPLVFRLRPDVPGFFQRFCTPCSGLSMVMASPDSMASFHRSLTAFLCSSFSPVYSLSYCVTGLGLACLCALLDCSWGP
ncbi:UDP-N-acetylglucosamine transferase subunit ALG14 homolog isoform X2 [Electrophorus electricus]|uniref:UDP-N-acetylglucosamine transferase subunit ALG14 homolog isoform X2 n=1 Tax=Electrophorus electricus TaxID=8005 RepID=UPI0015D09125|nr:UDP-N-acetylglucosamine transferase subunit ALG14 homolog isoform X2 [Electrophorus electricus]